MDDSTCIIDGCEKPIAIKMRGWCNMHYLRWSRNGDPLVTRKRPPGTPAPQCSVDGCEADVVAVGMCHRHRVALVRNGSALTIGEKSRIQRLRDVGWTVTDGGCWEWDGYRTDHNYGLITIKRRRWVASRLMLELHEPMPADGYVCRHKCDNPPCVNPDHLEWGSFIENMEDMVARKREQSFRASYWGGRCKSGLHDVTLPGAIIEPGPGSKAGRKCAGCARIRRNRARAKATTLTATLTD